MLQTSRGQGATATTAGYSFTPFQRASTAYHEAGHAIVGYCFGWWVNHEGVEIDDRQYCGLRSYSVDMTIEAWAVQTMAGWCAEHKWHGRGGYRFHEDDVAIVLSDFVHGCVGELEEVGDQEHVVGALLNSRSADRVRASDLLAEIQILHSVTTALLAHPVVWRSIQRLARALLKHGKLCDDQVETLVSRNKRKLLTIGRATLASFHFLRPYDPSWVRALSEHRIMTDPELSDLDVPEIL